MYQAHNKVTMLVGDEGSQYQEQKTPKRAMFCSCTWWNMWPRVCLQDSLDSLIRMRKQWTRKVKGCLAAFSPSRCAHQAGECCWEPHLPIPAQLAKKALQSTLYHPDPAAEIASKEEGEVVAHWGWWNLALRCGGGRTPWCRASLALTG